MKSKAGHLLTVAVSLGLVAMVVITITTMWATGQAQTRTACYQQATSVEQCGRRTAVETALAWAFWPTAE